MTLKEAKQHAKSLSAEDRAALLRYLQCLQVTEDPAWQRAMREAAELREAAERARQAGRRRKRAGAKAA